MSTNPLPPLALGLSPIGTLQAIEPTIVYHYTSLQTMTQIVASQSLWATNVKFLNDTAERDLFLRKMREHIQRTPSQMRGDADSILGEYLGSEDRHNRDLESQPSVVSFSRNGDSLPQWRAYSPKGRGVSIGFRVDCLRNASVLAGEDHKSGAWMFLLPRTSFGPVEYLAEQSGWKLQEALNAALDSARRSVEEDRVQAQAEIAEGNFPSSSFGLADYFTYAIDDRATFYKDQSFGSEEEYRIVVSSARFARGVVHYRHNDWTMVPYIPVSIPNSDLKLSAVYAQLAGNPNAWNAIEEVVIGPTADKELSAEVVRAYFRDLLMSVRVRTTTSTFRDW